MISYITDSLPTLKKEFFFPQQTNDIHLQYLRRPKSLLVGTSLCYLLTISVWNFQLTLESFNFYHQISVRFNWGSLCRRYLIPAIQACFFFCRMMYLPWCHGSSSPKTFAISVSSARVSVIFQLLKKCGSLNVTS